MRYPAGMLESIRDNLKRINDLIKQSIEAILKSRKHRIRTKSAAKRCTEPRPRLGAVSSSAVLFPREQHCPFTLVSVFTNCHSDTVEANARKMESTRRRASHAG